ncbi:polyprenyl synthetase family protein [Nocardia terpenica]|uniref:polyprenyl synthetase family protein n=1 Tax=Nocardia terpenica TaxID=455432 RepID=UPI001894F2DA|nr:polyprenyl synthetase family protein [Nocardia terpenica]MBF6065572.1 polyprenyl synthetase family protein [Nocardia terpenica]MBF6108626.1 polyprenyl synthetase family protein [Nocardia terpenica]MBF6115656.1 polyprenyl synthetase family protein [Nocardia terpenica]MBF6122817.1 polyprenyl synthetase family protein [Nocardia terpenica]MBF6155831.1 polyprenyl synthetase family protein [Nocardia terpenica]
MSTAGDARVRRLAPESVDLTEFASLLTSELEHEYLLLLVPYGLEAHAPSLAAGRLIRSRLAATAAGLLSDRLIRRCAALEMMHTSTLIHDDILDRGTVRRGLPTLWKAVGRERALLIGNLVAARALAIAQADSAEAANVFLETWQRVNVAQLREVNERGRVKDRAAHVGISIGKASAAMELGLVIGCMSSPGWPVDLTHLREAVREFGLGFQFADDVEDVRAWLGASGPRRSKEAEFDIDLGNLTLPVTILAESAGVRFEPAGRRSVQVLRALSLEDWEPCLQATFRIALDHLDRARWHLDRAEEFSGDRELARRVIDWADEMIESVRRKGLDMTLSELPQVAR